MPFRQLPNSDPTRITALDAAFTKYNNTSVAERLIGEALFAQLSTGRTDFKREVGELAPALSQQTLLTTQVDVAFLALGQIASHFIQVFNFGVQRGRFQRSDRAYYGLDVNHSEVPPMASYADAELWADRIVAGEAARAASSGSSYVAMAMPSATEVQVALVALRDVRPVHSAAKSAYDAEQADVEAARPATDALIKDVWDTVEFALRNLSGPSRRREAREWGVVYVPRRGEEPDPEEGEGGSGEDTPPGGGG